MKYNISIIIIALLGLLLSCTEDDQLETYCVDFDLRQCGNNPWLVDNQIPDSAEEHLNLISEYLKDNNVEVLSGEIDMRPNLVVCLACFVCPAGPRIRVEILPADTAAIYALDLLNLNTIVCPEGF